MDKICLKSSRINWVTAARLHGSRAEDIGSGAHRYLILRQDPNNAAPQKLGHFNEKTMGAYLLGSDLFVKRYEADPSKTYPDFGASYETFTNGDFLELETLGPLEEVAPGGTVEHVERWSLHTSVTIAEWTDAELDRVLPVQ
jgi:hypothetical protein